MSEALERWSVLNRFQCAIRSDEIRGTMGALLVYILAALVIFYPVPFRLRSVIAGFPARDGWQYTWWLWFAKRLLLQGRGLSDLYLMNHPLGLQHPFQWTLIYLSVMALPLEILFSPAATFNLMVLAAYVLSGLIAVDLPAGATGGAYRLLTGVYLWPNLERLSVIGPRTEANAFKLGSPEVTL
jgi:hypothetical protein